VARAAGAQFLLAAVAQLAGGIGIAAQILLGRAVLERLLVDGRPADFSDVAPLLGALATVSAGVAFVGHVTSLQQQLLGNLVANHALERIHRVTTRVDLLAFESPGFHDRLQRAVANAQMRPLQLTTGTLKLVSSSFAIVGIAAALLIIEPLFVLLIALAYVPTWLATTTAARDSYAFSVEQTERDRRRLYLSQLLTGRNEAKEIRAFNLSRFLSERHDALAAARVSDLRSMLRRQLRLRLLGSVATSALTAGAIAVLVYFVTSGRLDIASAVSAAAAVLMLGQRLQGLAGGASTIYEGSLFVEDFTTFVDLEPDIRAARPTKPAPTGFRRLAVENVSFTYPSGAEPALRDVSLDINAGEVVALVGENGSGKTTLAKLLAGLWPPESGRILWDGLDITSVDPEGIQGSVAVIFQDFVKYQLTARENIAMGRHERFDDFEAVQRAAGQSGAASFLAELRDGYETQLGPQYFGGTELSVGQWQRVALARAFFRDCPFIVLDEPTAALDPRAEHDLFRNIRSLAAGRTVLLISHRFSSVRSADRIYVLSAGRIVEQGTHDSLTAAGGLYAELFRLQAAAYLDPTGAWP
jgi:ATP-binding cassette subfamily B protein